MGNLDSKKPMSPDGTERRYSVMLAFDQLNFHKKEIVSISDNLNEDSSSASVS